MSSDAATPLMRQYHQLKQQVPNALLLFRLGDFYELFYEDAVTAARELEITLTSRSKEKDNAIPMCGVPHHSAERYIATLIQRGYRVAVCEQTEDPRFTKKLVKREIARVVTPGTATESSILKSRENNYLAAVAVNGSVAALAHVDLSTGEFKVTELEPRDVSAAIENLRAREVLVADAGALAVECLKTPLDSWIFDQDYSDRILRDHFHLLSLEGCGLAGKPLAVGAAGAILHYLRDTQKNELDHLERPAFYERGDAMILDAVTVRNLELLEPLFAQERKDSTLIHVLDQTCTAMGARLLRRRLLRPLLDIGEINARLDAVQEFLGATIARSELRKRLSEVLDLERLLAKVTLGTAAPREMLALGGSLAVVPELRFEAGGSTRLAEITRGLDGVPEVASRILEAIADEPPVSLSDGGTIRSGFNRELDELREISKNSRQFILGVESREKQRTGIASLKVRFNNVFGYYIEISKSNLHLVPSDYDRKQTLVNAERFTTPELKELEVKVLSAEEKILDLEKTLFGELRTFAASFAARIRETAAKVAELDVTAAMAELAAQNRYVRPRFVDSGELRIVAGRHPVIEKLTEAQGGNRFTPNDTSLDSDGKFIGVITGPNMGGKSTYLRQVALICVLAQTGCYVPADEAILPVIDRVFTRIGAADNLARGRSTFMVEMTETAVILNTATKNSLIVLDEIGRGTATYDGLALAWAVAEHIHEKIKARTLFATHYHELTSLADAHEGVRNLHVSVKEAGDQIIFLRKVQPGAADKSYGIEVARLAALPMTVIERARQILALHERTESQVSEELSPHASGPLQISMFEPVNYEFADRIRRVNLDELRPIDALKLLAELQGELKRQ